jgi:hypothetical protein
MSDSVVSDSLAASGLDGERSGRPGWLRGILGWADPYRGRPAKQYLNSLMSTYLAIRAEDRELPEPIAQQLEAVFAAWAEPGVDWAKAAAWDDAFLAERLMVSLYDPARLEVELERRILEAQSEGLAVAEFYRGRAGAAEPPAGPERVARDRALLARLTGDLQWHYSQRDLKRSYAHQAQKRVFWTFLVCLALFLAVMWLSFDLGGAEAG